MQQDDAWCTVTSVCPYARVVELTLTEQPEPVAYFAQDPAVVRWQVPGTSWAQRAEARRR